MEQNTSGNNTSTNRWVLITGASSGIGLELAKVFAEHSWSLVLVARRLDALNALAKDLQSKHGVSCLCLGIDLQSPHYLSELRAATKDRIFDCVINNAGIGSIGEFAKEDAATQGSLIHLNIKVLTELCREFIPRIKLGGSLINVASIAGFIPGPYMAVYYASKAYVLSLTESLNYELRDKIHVMALCPGPVLTGFQKVAGMGELKKSDFILTTARFNAEECYRAMQRKQIHCIPGFMNRVITKFIGRLPTSWVLNISARAMKLSRR